MGSICGTTSHPRGQRHAVPAVGLLFREYIANLYQCVVAVLVPAFRIIARAEVFKVFRCRLKRLQNATGKAPPSWSAMLCAAIARRGEMSRCQTQTLPSLSLSHVASLTNSAIEEPAIR